MNIPYSIYIQYHAKSYIIINNIYIYTSSNIKYLIIDIPYNSLSIYHKYFINSQYSNNISIHIYIYKYICTVYIPLSHSPWLILPRSCVHWPLLDRRQGQKNARAFTKKDLEDPIWDGKPVTAWGVQILIVFQLWKHKTYPLVNKHRPWKSPIFNGN
jgi:hypothetical protein